MLEAARPPLAPLSAAPHEPETLGGAGLSLHALLDVVRRRWLALFLCLAATLAAAAVYVSITPKRFTATATLLIDLRLAQLSQTETSGTVVDQAAVESQIELLRSEKMLVTVMKKRNLLNDPEFGGKTGKDVAPVPAGASPAEVAERRVIAVLGGNLWVARVGRSYLVNVSYSSPDAVKAAQIANDVVDAYIADQVDAKIQAAKDQNAWLDAQVNERRARAAQAYRAVQDFKSTHTINPLGDLGISHEIDRLAPDATRARSAVVTARARLDRVDEVTASPARATGALPPADLVRGLDDPEAERLAGQPPAPGGTADGGSAAGEAATAFWARVKVLADERRAEWLAASGKQQAVEGRLADLRLTDSRNRLLQERLRELETEAATSRSLYESYLNQLTHAAQQQPVPASDTRMISPAAIPLFPSAPRKMLTLALAAIAGSALGLLAMFVFESLDDVVRTRAQLERATRLPCIGLVPHIRRWSRRSGKVRPLGMRLRESLPGLAGFGPTSRARDVLRGLQFAAYHGAHEPGAPVLGVTSAIAGEGKTTIALNLAFSASQSGRRVLLVDCNLRSPTLTRLALGESAAPPSPGFDLRHSVRAEEGFDVLPASTEGVIEGAETPDTDLFRSLLTEARATYDLVIVDLPAILPLSEVRALIHQLDMVVLVTRWGSTNASQVERAMARLADVDHIVGVVLNGIRPRTMRRFEGSTHRAYADRL